MSGDLGAADAQVHAQADGVIAFWFALSAEQHFARDEALDREIAKRFGALRAGLLASEAEGWRETPEGMLAAILVLDQFSRNIHRGNAEAFAADPLAQTLALSAIRRGWHETMPSERAMFVLMPLMHSESRVLQRFSVECFAALGLERQLDYARSHAAVIDRFGRFPSRNEALGRPSRPAELDYLSQTDAGW